VEKTQSWHFHAVRPHFCFKNRKGDFLNDEAIDAKIRAAIAKYANTTNNSRQNRPTTTPVASTPSELGGLLFTVALGVTRQPENAPVPPASVGTPLARAKTAPTLARAKTEDRFDSEDMQYKEKKMAPEASGYEGEQWEDEDPGTSGYEGEQWEDEERKTFPGAEGYEEEWLEGDTNVTSAAGSSNPTPRSGRPGFLFTPKWPMRWAGEIYKTMKIDQGCSEVSLKELHHKCMENLKAELVAFEKNGKKRRTPKVETETKPSKKKFMGHF
jgi:hypothetical protein